MYSRTLHSSNMAAVITGDGSSPLRRDVIHQNPECSPRIMRWRYEPAASKALLQIQMAMCNINK